MSDLTSIDKLKLEKLFMMNSGYVLGFSNRTFQEFILDNTGKEIFDEAYSYASGSKANRLREFWKKEPNYLVGKLIADLIEFKKAQESYNINHSLNSWESDSLLQEKELYEECMGISERLIKGSQIQEINAIKPYSNDKEFELLSKSIKESINNNEPEVALDRLHTYVIKYFRYLCDKHGIEYDKNNPLHNLFGIYIKFLNKNSLIESQITERILQSSIGILDFFNSVRNNQSLAHANPILNHEESILIFNNISCIIRFIESIESKNNQDTETNLNGLNLEDIPF